MPKPFRLGTDPIRAAGDRATCVSCTTTPTATGSGQTGVHSPLRSSSCWRLRRWRSSWGCSPSRWRCSRTPGTCSRTPAASHSRSSPCGRPTGRRRRSGRSGTTAPRSSRRSRTASHSSRSRSGSSSKRPGGWASRRIRRAWRSSWSERAGLLLNLGVATLMHGGRQGSLNLQAAFRHVVADALASVGVIVAAVLVLAVGLEGRRPGRGDRDRRPRPPQLLERPARLALDPARDDAARDRRPRGGRSDGRRGRRRGRARPAHLDDHVRISRAVGARALPSREPIATGSGAISSACSTSSSGSSTPRSRSTMRRLRRRPSSWESRTGAARRSADIKVRHLWRT